MISTRLCGLCMSIKAPVRGAEFFVYQADQTFPSANERYQKQDDDAACSCDARKQENKVKEGDRYIFKIKSTYGFFLFNRRVKATLSKQRG